MLCKSLGLSAWLTIIGMPALAQVTPDGTVGTVVNGSTIPGATAPYTVTEGTVRSDGTNATLFHSFDTFSPDTGNVTFDLRDVNNMVDTSTVNVVIGRITGTSNSFIDGQLSIEQDMGTPVPDLFLINPNGITFGSNASLNLPGSFSASSATSISFTNNVTFSATDPGAAPLLTVSTPVGQQFNAGFSRTVTAQGNGHSVTATSPRFMPYTDNAPTLGLSVSSGETLSLIGHPVSLEGATLRAPGGRIELGGVVTGSVNLNWQSQGFTLDYSQSEQFSDLSLTEQALIDISGGFGTNAGASHLQGQRIRIEDGSLLWSQNRGVGSSGPITLQATDEIMISGTPPTLSAVSSIVSETIVGETGDITITTPSLTVEGGAAITNLTFSAASTGRITLNADHANIIGYTALPQNLFSAVITNTSSSGNAGNVEANVRNLNITEGGFLGSSTLGSGQGGDVIINSDQIHVAGATPQGVSSIISATTAGLTGDAGDINITTRELNIENSGLVVTSSIGIGNAGDVRITASERIGIRNGLPNLSVSSIASNLALPASGLQQLLGLTNPPQGEAGSIVILTPILELNTGQISVANPFQGNAGEINIDAELMVLNNSTVSALTVDGDGGNINLTLQDVLLTRNGSQISSSVQGGKGNGGNITILVPILIGLENSDIFANAITGNGGNINIVTQAIYGLEFRDQLTPENDITASSQFGVSGTVEINNFGIDPGSGLVELPESLADASNQVAQGCASDSSSTFTATGRGGVPTDPSVTIGQNRTWTDTRIFASSSINANNPGNIARHRRSTDIPLTEATTWHTNATGQLELVAASNAQLELATATCAGGRSVRVAG